MNQESNASETITTPRHWMDLEELSSQYWENPKSQELRGQEFQFKPIETIAAIDSEDKKGLHRRDFLTIMGASMAMASFSCARRPVHKIIPYVVRPEEVVPGIATHYASVCGECAQGCGIVVKNREGRPIKLEGNPDHPVNRGSLCAKGQASLLNLYDPSRLKLPVKVSRKGESSEISWKEMDAIVSAKLRGARVRVLSRSETGPTHRKLMNEFLAGQNEGSWVEYEPSSLDGSAEAQEKSYGSVSNISIQLDQADLVVSLGADFLGTWGNPVEQTQSWMKKRKLDSTSPRNAWMSKLVSFEAGMSLTGSNADERYPIRPGDEFKIAMALLHELVIKEKRSKYSSNESVAKVLRGYSSKVVASEIGGVLTEAALSKVASELWENRGKSAVLAGGIPSHSSQSVALHVAVNFLNSILENDGRIIEASAGAVANAGQLSALLRLRDELQLGTVDLLIIHRANPVYELPEVLGFSEAIQKAGMVLVVGEQFHETARKADLAIPDTHYLENWGDSNSRAGVIGFQQPAVSPLHDTRSFQDSLMVWMKASGKASASVSKSADWHAYLKDFHSSLLRSDEAWEGALRKGVITNESSRKSGPRTFKESAFSVLPAYLTSSGNSVLFGVYEKPSMGDGRSASNAWLQEMPDPISTITWDNYLNVSPALAESNFLEENDVVQISNSTGQNIEVPVHVQPGLHPLAATLAVGYGRAHAGPVGSGVGAYALKLAEGGKDRAVLNGVAVTLVKTGKRYPLAVTQGHHRTEGRPVLNDITLKEFRRNPRSENHTDPHLRMKEVPTIWSHHDFTKGYRWGMTIDLSACTGCGACVIACQAENNIPVVGRDRVRMGREMHWIRIDRYYSGPAENPDVVYQPMLCQHCENAPCETVCPVIATLHNEEGLNEMVYNRCVGTRYCQNNCPYKVRRFNFFDHWKDYRDEMNLVWNPDVTVRSRGVMEKCTFCVQRIQESRSRAKDRKTPILEGDLKTACQQTCPSNAIVFGNINDPQSQVSKTGRDARSFRVLEVLNTKPSVTYLSKVRNKEEGAHGHG